jgi:AcrR family transcriptional regulator
MATITLRAPTTAAALGYGRINTGRTAQGPRTATAERAILDVAAAHVAERGTRTLSLASVAAATGYGGAIVAHRFGDRAGLLDALTKDLQDRFRPPAGDGSGRARLAAFAGAYLGEPAPCARVFTTLWTESLTGDADLRAAFAARDARLRATLAEYLRAGLDDGSIRYVVHPEATAYALAGRLRVRLLERVLRTG